MRQPTINELRILRILIWIGVFFVGRLLFWFFGSDHQGYPLFYWPLTLSFLLLIVRLLGEWFYYYRITFPTTPPTPRRPPFTVDIFTTYCPGEPKEMVIRTLEAIQRIPYPHTTYLCDEANDEYLKERCREMNVRHVTRRDRRDAKAGNINNALAQSQGELCLVLDPDHVPVPGFLEALVPYFQDPQMGFVQSVQAYYNQGESYVAKGAAQQTYLFYGPLMLGMNGYGTVPAIGANCFFRREALDSIGGHASGLAEDMHTSLKLHARGWKSVFHPEILSRGLVPSTLSAYYQQQLKWSKGTWDIMLHSFLAQFGRLSPIQRLHYGSAALFYLMGFVCLINLIIPVLSLVTSRFPWRVDIVEFAEMTALVVAQMFFIRHYVQRWVFEETERGFHAVGGILFISSWWIYCLGVVYAILRVPVPYLPTPKEHNSRLDVRLHLPNLLLIVVSLSAVVYGLLSDWSPYAIFMVGFALTNVVILSTGVSWGRGVTLRRDSFVTQLIQQILTPSKVFLWKVRHALYLLIRQYALPLCLGLVTLGFFLTNTPEDTPVDATKHTGDSPLIGLSAAGMQETNQARRARISIMASQAASWSSSPEDSLALLVEQANAANKMPYFSWSFARRDTANTTVSAALVRGEYDKQLAAMKRAIRQSHQPVFLHPQLPVLREKASLSEAPLLLANYLEAWQYLHDQFGDLNHHDIVWVWSADSLSADYYPGAEYVDWIAVSEGQEGSVEALLAAIPRPASPLLWYEEAPRPRDPPEDRATVTRPLQGWVSAIDQARFPSLGDRAKAFLPEKILTGSSRTAVARPKTAPQPRVAAVQKTTIKGVAYTPFNMEEGDPVPLIKHTLEGDFLMIKNMGANTIRRYRSDIFDRNVLTYAEEAGLNVIFGLDLPSSLDYYKDTLALRELESSVLSTVSTFKEAPAVLLWNLSNATYAELDQHFAKPYLLLVRQSYLTFVNRLAEQIHQIDPQHPVMDAIRQDDYLSPTLSDYRNLTPYLDIYGFDTYQEAQLQQLDSIYRASAIPQPYLISSFGPDSYWSTYQLDKRLLDLVAEPRPQAKAEQYARQWKRYIADSSTAALGGVALQWQDQRTGSATWSGLVDFKGRPTPSYYCMQQVWQSGSAYPPDYDVQIVWQGNRLLPLRPYQINAIVRGFGGDENSLASKYHYEWYVHEEDDYGRIQDFYPIGDDQSSLQWTSPQRAGTYRLYVFVQNEAGATVSASSPFVVY